MRNLSFDPIKLGDSVKDKLTPFKGTVVARAEYLYGCIWVCVVAEELHEGKPIDEWFDEKRLELVEEQTKRVRPFSGKWKIGG